jgi:hypothetical protein
MTITAAGDVGIGTTTPGSKLDVVGLQSLRAYGGTGTALGMYSYRGTVASPVIVNAGDTLGALTFYGWDGDQTTIGTFIISTVEAGVGNNLMPADLQFWTNPGSTLPLERMRITGSGNIGIGNTTPANKLFVTGDIGLDGILVKDTATLTTTATTQVTLIQYPTATYNTGEFVIQAVSAGVIHTTKMLVVCNTTVAIATEFGSLLTGGSLFTVDCDISSANTRIRITPASTTSTTFKASYELITA